MVAALSKVLVGSQCVHQPEVVEQRSLLQAIRHKHVLEHNVRSKDFTRARIGEARSVATKGREGARGPAQHVVANVARIPVRVVGLYLHHDGVAEPCLFKSLVPCRSGALNNASKLQRGGIFNPPGDGLDHVADRFVGVHFYQLPTVNHVAVVRGLWACHVVDLLAKVAYARVVSARTKIRGWHCQNTVLQAHGDVPRIRDVGASPCCTEVVVH